MAYQDHFRLADELILHLNSVILTIADPFIESRYVGFVSVVGTTVYELAIKEIFLEFSEKKHKVFGTFAGKYFERLNGRIKTKEIRDNYLKRFGDQYATEFSLLLDQVEEHYLKSQGVSILSSYNNVIGWRNQFAHEGKLPSTASYHEVTRAYDIGKEVIYCLNEAMQM